MFSTFELIHIISIAGLSLLTNVKSDNRPYAKCYNATSEMHCFSTTFERLANFSDAQNHCAQINATLLVIKSEEVQNLVERFMNDSDPDNKLTFVWTSANLNISMTWHWLDSTVPLPADFNSSTKLSGKDVACLEFQLTSGTIVNIHPIEPMNYICQCSDLYFGRETGNVLHHNGTYYVAFEANVTWYEARNRCFKGKCDLASFRNLSSINLTNWIDTSPGKRYWIGLRQGEWNWNTSGESLQVIFTNWWKNYPIRLPLHCVAINKNVYGSYTWDTVDCYNEPTIFAVCQTVTPLNLETNMTTYAGSKCTTSSSTTSIVASASTAPTRGFDDNFGIRVGVGVGVGVGVPLLIGLLIVIIIVLSKRKRKDRKNEKKLTAQSAELGNLPKDALETEKVETTKGGIYSQVKNDDSASPINIEDKTTKFSEPNVNNGSNIVYSVVEFNQETD